jgi:hypothetical protein
MEDPSNPITGKFVSVRLPDFSTCSKTDLRYTVFNDSCIFSTLPKPYITSWEPPVVQEAVLVQLPDPVVGENLVTELQSGIDHLCQGAAMAAL